MQSFKIYHETAESIPVIYIEGDMTSESEEELLSVYKKICSPTPPEKLFFNFKKTNYINSSGIGILIALIEDLGRTKGKVSFIGLSNHFMKVMDIVGLSDFVKFYETMDEALSTDK